MAGKFIVLDGPDGCGKSTQTKLLAEYLTGQGVKFFRCETRAVRLSAKKSGISCSAPNMRR